MPEEAEVPVLSFNSQITSPDAYGPAPDAAQLKAMKAANPKLAGAWTIWEQYKADSKPANFADLLKPIVSFDTVAKFWGCWNHVPQPSELFDGKKFMRGDSVLEALMIFRKGVRPEWEDPSNVWGGHYQLTLEPKLGDTVDEVWNNLVVGMMSGGIENSDLLTGIRLVDKLSVKTAKACIRIELWFNDISDDTEDKRYKLRGSFEKTMCTRFDGSEKKGAWSNTKVVSHVKK